MAPGTNGPRGGCMRVLGCATKGAEDQWMRDPPEELSVHLSSYPSGESRSLGDNRLL